MLAGSSDFMQHYNSENIGQVESAETKTEVRKQKYGSEKKKPPGSRMCLVGKRVAVSKRCESQVLIHRTPANTNTAV